MNSKRVLEKLEKLFMFTDNYLSKNSVTFTIKFNENSDSYYFYPPSFYNSEYGKLSKKFEIIEKNEFMLENDITVGFQ